MNKFKKVPCINQRQGKNGWTFQVVIRSDVGTITKSFREKDYESARVAYESAIVYKNKTVRQIQDGLMSAPSDYTVDKIFNMALESSTFSYNTKIKHVKLYNKYITCKKKKISELTKYDIIEDLNKMVDTASDSTIQRVLSIYRTDIVTYALNRDIITRDLLAGIKAPRSRLITVKRKTTTDRETILEVERLLLSSGVDEYNAQLCVYLIELLYYTGMRPAEAEALTRSDIKENYISVNKQLGSDREDVHVITRCKTDDSVREIPIHPNLKPILEELLDFAEYDELFRKNDGRYLDSTFVGNIIHRITKGTGIQFNLYRLRHNMATQLVTSGTDTRTTMELLGHANYNMSLGYANSSEERKKDAIKQFS